MKHIGFIVKNGDTYLCWNGKEYYWSDIGERRIFYTIAGAISHVVPNTNTEICAVFERSIVDIEHPF